MWMQYDAKRIFDVMDGNMLKKVLHVLPHIGTILILLVYEYMPSTVLSEDIFFKKNGKF